MLCYYEWLAKNENDIIIELAESGADREMDFNLEFELSRRYDEYCKNYEIGSDGLPESMCNCNSMYCYI